MATPLARQATDFLGSIGYQATNLVPDCAFTWRAEDQSLKNQAADLVAFSSAPHTMRTACVGVFTAASQADVVMFLQKARFLTAPLAIIGTPEVVSIYSVRREAALVPIESSPPAVWSERFRSRLSDLTPERLYAAKTAVGGQTSLFDSGLWSWAESITAQTLSSLLESLLARALADLPGSYQAKPAAHAAIIRLILQMFACRVLEDKGLINSGGSLERALELAHSQFSENIQPDVVRSSYLSRGLVDSVEADLRSKFAFATLTTEMLGSAYENALVTPKLRKERGIYYTPRSITNYLLSKLPIESLPLEDRILCDPCCGSGSFLLAGFDRLSRLLPDDWSPARRHQHLRARIFGFDIDDMAREIAGLSLVLADPYNKNGWKIRDRDATELAVSDMGQRPTIVATNPPFREIKSGGKRSELASLILARLIDLVADDGLLAVVTPQSILDSKSGAASRQAVLEKCDVLEVDALAGGLFYSGAETAALLLRKRPRTKAGRSIVSVATIREVRSRDVTAFKELGAFTRTYSAEPSTWQADELKRFTLSPLADIWRRLADQKLPLLGTIAVVRNGLQVKTADKKSVSAEQRPGLVKFIDRLDVLRPFALLAGQSKWPFKWLRYGPHLHRARAQELFTAKKVVVNATRNPGSSWRLVAAMAGNDVYFSDHFHGITPKPNGPSLEEIAAVLNGPIANAWYDGHSRNRKILVETLGVMPFPEFSDEQRRSLRELVKKLEKAMVEKWTREDRGLFYDEGPLVNEPAEAPGDVALLLEQVDSIVARAYRLDPSEMERLRKVVFGDKRPA